jgi:hypothetical protein
MNNNFLGSCWYLIIDNNEINCLLYRAEAINVLLEFVQQIDHDQGEIRIKRDAERVS